MLAELSPRIAFESIGMVSHAAMLPVGSNVGIDAARYNSAIFRALSFLLSGAIVVDLPLRPHSTQP